MKNKNRSEQVVQLGQNFLKKLMNGEILEATRPNKGREYTGIYEKLDLLEYRRFLCSYTYKDLFDSSEAEYGQY